MLAKLLRRLGWLAYAAGVAAIFIIAGYWSFGLFVRRGVTTVPDLAGLQMSEAAARLKEAGLKLRLGEGGERYHESVPAGRILAHDPSGGDLVKRGSAIEAQVSLGPELIEVPELRGSALRAAQVKLSAAGLALASTASIYSAAGVPGTVVDQDPAAGTRVSRTTPVRLFLSRESRTRTYLMPDLVYRDFEQVRRFFDGRGIRLGSVKFESYEGILPGVVLRQFPLAGHPLRQGDVISLVVASEERAGA